MRVGQAELLPLVEERRAAQGQHHHRRNARALAEREGLDLSRCTAYSDSSNDVPMLSAVGHAVAVNPDTALRGMPPVTAIAVDPAAVVAELGLG